MLFHGSAQTSPTRFFQWRADRRDQRPAMSTGHDEKKRSLTRGPAPSPNASFTPALHAFAGIVRPCHMSSAWCFLPMISGSLPRNPDFLPGINVSLNPRLQRCIVSSFFRPQNRAVKILLSYAINQFFPRLNGVR
jgi:hypothetical protein